MRMVSAALAWVVLATAAPAAAETAGFKDWRVACDNVQACMAIGFSEGEYAIGPYLVIRREPGPDGAIEAYIVLTSGDQDPPKGAQVAITVTGAKPKRFTGTSDDAADFPRIRFTDAQVPQLIAALKDGSGIRLEAGGRTLGTISLAGSSAALRWIDDRQGRAGGVTAMVATGRRPALAVPAPKDLPVWRAGPRVDQEALPPFPAALAARPEVKACAEEQGDPDDGFGKPEAVARLSKDEYLWAIPCGRGAYNFSALYMIADRNGGGLRSPGLGDDDMLVNGGFDPETRILAAFNKGRGPGDCGQEDEFVWDGRTFRQLRHAEMNDCRGVPSVDWLVTYRAQVR